MKACDYYVMTFKMNLLRITVFDIPYAQNLQSIISYMNDPVYQYLDVPTFRLSRRFLSVARCGFTTIERLGLLRADTVVVVSDNHAYNARVLCMLEYCVNRHAEHSTRE